MGQLLLNTHIVESDFKNHYIEASSENGVALRGKRVSFEEADKLVLMRSAWILEKFKDIEAGVDEVTEDIVTGSRIMYFGRRYFTEIKTANGAYLTAKVLFKYSKFDIIGNPQMVYFQDLVQEGLKQFYLEKAQEKLPKRFKYWQQVTGLKSVKICFNHLDKRWGGCSPENMISINVNIMKLHKSVYRLCYTP